ncbi:hypothetical protein JRQ81_016385 [Phrynocephalus forsythii]|uniref:Uncharacterized protein n=1 Tax=Phrynocephalus forsythii TaxID=171643 RepID=A0A9Q0XS59_9SAUR|nr:hypothetical protein JRQ81_016385 [Phrynocephalus forsythii]
MKSRGSVLDFQDPPFTQMLFKGQSFKMFKWRQLEYCLPQNSEDGIHCFIQLSTEAKQAKGQRMETAKANNSPWIKSMPAPDVHANPEQCINTPKDTNHSTSTNSCAPRGPFQRTLGEYLQSYKNRFKSIQGHVEPQSRLCSVNSVLNIWEGSLHQGPILE